MLIFLGVVVLAIVASLVMQVDDWSRDLSVNRAATRIDSPDAGLRSLEVSADEHAVRTAIMQFVEQSPAWSVDERTTDTSPGPTIALVRTSKLFRFCDDVDLFLQATDTGTKIDVTSQSRVGKGDLGQNPRNIRELLAAVRQKF